MSVFLKILLHAYPIARLAGIPIKIHFTLPIMLLYGAWLTGSLLDAGLLMLIVCFMLACITLHELGHALVAMRKGCYVHEILLTPIGGVARIIAAPMDAKDETQIAIAGPLVSLCLAPLWFIPAFLAYLFEYHMAGMVFATLCIANLIFFLFNLIPAFPMDGGRIFRAWLSLRIGRLEATRIASLLGRVFALLFFLAAWLIPHWPLMLIAFFIYFIAGYEYAHMVKMMRPHPADHPYHTPLFDNDGLVVSEPPYEAPTPTSKYHLGREILTAIRILREEWPRLLQTPDQALEPRG